MPLITGTLSDFGLNTLSDYLPTIVFTPSSVALVGGRVLATRPIHVTPNAVGYFEVELAATDTLEPTVWYEMQVRWLEPGGGYSHIDFVDFRLHVPPQGGTLLDLLRTTTTNRLLVIWQEAEPNPWPVGVVWANPATGDLLRKDS